MEKVIYEFLEKIEQAGYEAYLVGGFPRDLYLGKENTDYDVCTSAPPTILKTIFQNIVSENYGSLKIRYKDTLLEVTTYRLENAYISTRTPVVSFTTSLKEDLQRRDFIINSLCLNKDKEYIDYLGAREDLNRKIIRSIGDPTQKLREDPLRILRAIRFATVLNFKIESSLSEAIFTNRNLVSKLSYYRKKEELDKILQSPNCCYGIALLESYDLNSILECEYSNIVFVPNLEAMWAQITASDQYPFTKLEKNKIEQIKSLLSQDAIKDIDLYNYGLEICSLVVQIKGESIEDITLRYELLPIHQRKEINISLDEIKKLTEESPSSIYLLLEKQILECNLKNEYNALQLFLKEYLKMKRNKIE